MSGNHKKKLVAKIVRLGFFIFAFCMCKLLIHHTQHGISRECDRNSQICKRRSFSFEIRYRFIPKSRTGRNEIDGLKYAELMPLARFKKVPYPPLDDRMANLYLARNRDPSRCQNRSPLVWYSLPLKNNEWRPSHF